MRTYANQRVADHGTTLTQMRTLKLLSDQDGRTQVQLAEELEIQPISLVRLLDRMVAQGLVERRPSPRDRRARLIFVTDAGRAMVAQLTPVTQAIMTEITEGVTDSEIAVLLDLLDRINTNARRALTRFPVVAAPQEDSDVR